MCTVSLAMLFANAIRIPRLKILKPNNRNCISRHSLCVKTKGSVEKQILIKANLVNLNLFKKNTDTSPMLHWRVLKRNTVVCFNKLKISWTIWIN